jgi:hypothetical protein
VSDTGSFSLLCCCRPRTTRFPILFECITRGCGGQRRMCEFPHGSNRVYEHGGCADVSRARRRNAVHNADLSLPKSSFRPSGSGSIAVERWSNVALITFTSTAPSNGRHGRPPTGRRSPSSDVSACSFSACALYLRSVCVATMALRRLRCHPPTCISLKLRLSVDSTPTRFRHLFSLTWIAASAP